MTRRLILYAALVLAFLPIHVAAQSKPKTPTILEQLGQYGPIESNADVLEYKAAMSAKDFETARLIRNDILYHGKIGVDLNYGEFKRKQFKEKALLNTVFDIGTDALTVGIGMTDVVKTKNLLTGILSLATGGRRAYEKNFWKSQSLPAVISSMEAGRLQKATEIENKKIMTVQDYGLYEALADLVDYFNKGTLESGLESLNDAAGARLQAAKVEATVAREVRINAARQQQLNGVPKQ